MGDLETRKKQLELSRVRLAKEELEFKIIEREDEIERLKAAVIKQKEREDEILKELSI